MKHSILIISVHDLVVYPQALQSRVFTYDHFIYMSRYKGKWPKSLLEGK
jgi:hypothetical protein